MFAAANRSWASALSAAPARGGEAGGTAVAGSGRVAAGDAAVARPLACRVFLLTSVPLAEPAAAPAGAGSSPASSATVPELATSSSASSPVQAAAGRWRSTPNASNIACDSSTSSEVSRDITP